MTLDLNIAGGTSDMGFQVWTAVRLGISSLNSCQTSDPRAHESKIQDVQETFLGSRVEILDSDPRSKIQDVEKLVLENLGSTNPNWIQDFCPGSTKSFLNILNDSDFPTPNLGISICVYTHMCIYINIYT